MSEVSASTAQTRDRFASDTLNGLSAAGRAAPIALLASMPGLLVLAGYDNLAYGLGALAGIVLAGLLIAPGLARTGAATIPKALDHRFGRPAAMAGVLVIVLVALSLLCAEFTLVGIVAEAALGVPYPAAVAAALLLGLATALFLGDRRFGWLTILAYALLVTGLLLPLVLMALKTHGIAVPPIAYGQALTEIAGLEEKLLENGLVDFETFSAHVTPFLRKSRLDLAALVVSLAFGLAVLPHLVSTLAAGTRPIATRHAGSWTALFLMLVLITFPALAAYAKLEIYSAIAAGTPLSALPSWLEAPSRADLAHIHGTSVAMLEVVAKAVSDGADSATAVAGHLATHAQQRWLALDPQIQAAVLASARTMLAAPATASPWDVYLTTVLPAAAAAAGNEAATLTQASLVIEPAGLLLALPTLSGAPSWAAALMAACVLVASLVMAAALVRGLMSAGLDALRESAPRRTLVLASGTAIAAAGLALLRPNDLVTIVVSALSLGAAGLFPVLAVGLAWKRATQMAAILAIVVGAGVTLYYDVGIQAFPAAFYRTWAPLSNAGEFAVEQFNELETQARDAEDNDVKAAAAADLETLARGTSTRSGLANWAGVSSASGAVFGVPAGMALLVIVSLLTRRRVRPQP